LAMGVVPMDLVRPAGVCGSGAIRDALLVDAPRSEWHNRAVHLRPLLPHPVPALRSRGPSGNRADRAASIPTLRGAGRTPALASARGGRTPLGGVLPVLPGRIHRETRRD